MTRVATRPARSKPYADCPAEVLRCPLSRGALSELSAIELDVLNARVQRGELKHADGTPVQGELERGFVSADGAFAYGQREGIALLLPALAIPLTPQAAAQAGTLRTEKRAVQQFYDDIGWSAAEGSEDFVDADNWEDLRPVSREYIRRCHLRVKDHLRPSGQFLLDVASGPVQYDEYLTYSQGYAARICVDISCSALRQAQQRLGSRGIYILGDITNLPLADGAVDGAVSLHTIYHTPADEQASAFREIYRVLAPGASAAIVYCWRSLLIKLAMLPAKLVQKPVKLLRKLTTRKAASPDAANRTRLYYHAHPHGWFARELGDLPHEIRVWRSIDVPMMRAYCHRGLLGTALLKLVYQAEEWLPRLLGRYGAYPLIVLRKNSGD
jgi:ubiquinone/menaquinone biosynthesis C-methylase UbiE